MLDQFRLAICIGFVIAWSGCTPPSPPQAPTAKVSGTVNLDSKPVPKGEIHFGMLGVPPRVLKITNGNFSGEAPIGENQVEIYIYKEGPPSPRYPDVPTKTNTVPKKYWGPKTVLKATVKEGGSDGLHFDITSQ